MVNPQVVSIWSALEAAKPEKPAKSTMVQPFDSATMINAVLRPGQPYYSKVDGKFTKGIATAVVALFAWPAGTYANGKPYDAHERVIIFRTPGHFERCVIKSTGKLTDAAQYTALADADIALASSAWEELHKSK
jgi:hypothetical protein